jgi:Xaa-Pro aminopeptidase
VLIDFGVKYHGYRSDMARTFFYNFVSPEKQNIYEKLKKNQQYALQNIAPGKVAGEFFSEVAKKFHDQGLSKFLYSSIGHGIGIKNHEMPSLKLVSEEVLLESEILTIEPGIYFPGKYGMRLEDVVFLSSEGTQVFTDFSKDLRVI